MQNYPEELVVKIENGKISTNVQEPFYIKFSQGYEYKNVDNFLAIDTKNPVNIDKFDEYKSYCLLTRESLICYDNDAIRVSSLEEVPDIIIDKNKISFWIGKIKPFFNLIYPLFFIMAIAMFFMIISFRLIYLLFFAILVWVVAKIKKINMGYWKSYQTGMHLMTPAFIVLYLLSFIAPDAGIPFFFTIIALLAAIINLKNIPSEKSDQNPLASQASIEKTEI
jgi:hypothetical protein